LLATLNVLSKIPLCLYCQICFSQRKFHTQLNEDVKIMQETSFKLVNNFHSAQKFLAERAAHLMSIDIIRSLLSKFGGTFPAQQQTEKLQAK